MGSKAWWEHDEPFDAQWAEAEKQQANSEDYTPAPADEYDEEFKASRAETLGVYDAVMTAEVTKALNQRIVDELAKVMEKAQTPFVPIAPAAPTAKTITSGIDLSPYLMGGTGSLTFNPSVGLYNDKAEIERLKTKVKDLEMIIETLRES